MDKVVLPFTDTIESSTYQYVAYLLGTMKSQLGEQYPLWLASKYINCYWDAIECECKFTDLDEWDLNKGLSTSSYLKMEKSFVYLPVFDLIRILERMIENKYYISGDFDEFFIPQRIAYQRYHHDHDYFLFGFDHSRKVFLTAGYLQDGKYHTQEISYSDYLNSLLGLSTSLIPMAFRHVQKDCKVVLDIEETRERIRAYLNSQNDMQGNDNTKKYGVSAWNAIKDYVLSCENGQLDVRIFRLFMEHKYLMFNRLKVLLQYGVGNKKSLDDYQEIQTRAGIVFMKALKQKCDPCERNKNRLAEYLMPLCEKEIKCLQTMI